MKGFLRIKREELIMVRNLEKCNELVARDRNVIATGSRITYYPLVIKSGHGAIIEDVDGNEYIDMLSSAGAINTGH